ncbi:MAG TPA: Tc toxin subunit A, partial [Ferruginibacter sp.]|nr:Tc toxin subunit A [Ferruginibacter sp.]
NKTNVANQHPLVNDLKEIDGFDQLFGNQDFCDCEHCRSVLGPAAYFCDLMYFVQENVSKKVFTGSNLQHPLYLKRRRPDLWKLTLTCDHTSTEIPYLQVVNEVLQTYLQTELGIADIYEHLKTADRSVNQPFNLSLEELRLYLSHFGLSLYEVYKQMQSAVKAQHRERLKLSPAQLTVITAPDTAGVKKRFGNKALATFNVQEFIAYAGITRRQLDDLLVTSFIPDISQVKVKTIKDPSDIQKYTEQLENLTDVRLDYIHRYLRLWKKTSWTIREFDLLLNALKSKTWLNNLEEVTSGYEKILQLAQLMIFQDRLGAGVEEMATITYQLPEKEIVDNQGSFASRIFDLNKINDVAVTDKTPYILSGLGITEAELLALTPVLSINLSQPITIAVLSNLYRHARIARGLRWTIEDLVYVMGLVLNGQPVQTFDDIQKLVDFSDWLQKTPLKIGDIVFILQGTETSTNQYSNTLDTLSAKVLEIQTQEAIVKEADANIKLTMKRNLLRDYILSSFNITASQLDNQFLTLVSNVFNNASATALNTTFTNEKPDQPADFNDLLDLLHKLERYNLLFTRHEFMPDNITYIIDNQAVFGIADLKALTLPGIANISLYRELALLNNDTVEKLQDALISFQTSNNFTGHEQSLADVWKQPLSLITSVLNNVTLAVPALDAARQFWNALMLCEKLGIQGDSLKKLAGSDYKIASGVALGAFSSKYPDEATRKEKLDPYTDKLHTLKRDALCDYIISREDKFKFSDLTD